MTDAAERALANLEDAERRVTELARGASYGFRVAAKRIGDLTAKGGPLPGALRTSADEMQKLIAALEHAEENLTEAVVLALGDHFREYLRNALTLPKLPGLPPTPEEVERLAGTPGALQKAPFELRLLLQLYEVALGGGHLTRTALARLGVPDLELAYASGKVKLYREGDRVALSEEQFEAMGKAVLEAARAVRLRLATS